MKKELKKRSLSLLLAAALLATLTACGSGGGETPDPPPADPPQQSASASAEPVQPEPEVQEPEVQEPKSPIGIADSFWVGYEWDSEDGEGAEGPFPLDEDVWQLDLLIRTDGTARFRDIHDGLYLMEEADLELTWEQEEDGTLSFYNDVILTPTLRGRWKDGSLSVEYRGTTLSMAQAQLPENAGKLYCPAELVGTWVMVSGETEGSEWEPMPGRLESLVFLPTFTAESATLTAERQVRDYYGNVEEFTQGAEVTVLDLPLYDGCGNEVWSVRIGPEAEKDEYGYPKTVEYYATLVDRNRLEMQRWFSLDGAPMVSYQTYWRMAERATWWEIRTEELADTHWECVGYTDADGAEQPFPPGLEDFWLHLNEDASCWTGSSGEGKEAYPGVDGLWRLGSGGTLMFYGDDSDGSEFWYGGAVRGYSYETERGFVDDYEMLLYFRGGVIRLDFTGYG